MFSDYFLNQPVWLNLVFFALTAGVIWASGTRLERYTDKISTLTGLGQAFGGMILLAGATSLLELATTVTSGLTGNINLAVHNLLGGDIMQTAILAFIDVAVVR
ncbi:MAG: hypothetical protein KY468_20410, partial [Armatimonadetes bacterium]|nr:hypothetical protein [Armatimonadota bacterium]